MKAKGMVLTPTEKKGWPILELHVQQIDKKGKKVRNGAGWTTWQQRDIRRMLPKRILSHFGLGVVLLALSGAVAGCAGTGYKIALQKVGDIGPRIAADIKPTDAGGEARKQAFLDLVEECRSLGAK